MQVGDLGHRIERDHDNTEIASAGSQNLVSHAHLGFDFFGRLNGHNSFRVQFHGVGLFVVRGQRRADQRVHP
jgi:hypothetical protein